LAKVINVTHFEEKASYWSGKKRVTSLSIVFRKKRGKGWDTQTVFS